MANVAEWNFKNGPIEDDLETSAFVSNDSVIIGATPYPHYSADALADAKVIGLIQDWANVQSREALDMFEVGSNGKYILSSGHVTGQITLTRIIYNGPNLLYAIYAASGRTAPALNANDIAGFDKFLINLGSSFFNRPVGMVWMIRDNAGGPAGAFFIEAASIVQHQIRGSAGGNGLVVAENVVLRYRDIKPLAHKEGAVPVGQLTV